MERFTGLVRRCVEDYHMIEQGDRIAVGVSGGKDSLALLCALAALRSYYPKRFKLFAITVDMGFEDMDYTPVKELCRRLQVPYMLVRTHIKSVVFDDRAERNPCSLCARMRKGVLSETVIEQGLNKVALGHHKNDAVETFLMSLFYEGRIHCFSPVTDLSRTGITQIRPLLYAGEEEVSRLVRRYALPVVESTCPMNNTSKRQDVKELVSLLSDRYPDLTAKLFGALQRYPLKGFAPSKHLKRKL